MNWLDWLAVAVFAASVAVAWRSHRREWWLPIALSNVTQKVVDLQTRLSVLEYERRVRQAAKETP